MGGRGEKTKHMIRLAKGGKCTIEGASAGFEDEALAWLVECTYTENRHETGKGVKSITCKVEKSIAGNCPHVVGSSFDVDVEKGAINMDIHFDGVRCVFTVGPDIDLKQLMTTDATPEENKP